MQKAILWAGSVSAVLFASAGPAVAQTNLVSDGDFASTSFSGPRIAGTGYVAFLTGATFGSWTVLSGNVDRVVDLWNAPVSGASVDLDGNTPGAIGQTLALASGAYRLSFYLSGNGPSAKTVQVAVGDTTKTFEYASGGGALPGPPYTLSYVVRSFEFLALGPTQLSFRSLGLPSSLGGPVIGNISVTAVPEPTNSALFLLGLGVFAFLQRRVFKLSPVAARGEA